jgi:hypothetical protein
VNTTLSELKLSDWVRATVLHALDVQKIWERYFDTDASISFRLPSFSIWYQQSLFFKREYSNSLLYKPSLRFLFKNRRFKPYKSSLPGYQTPACNLYDLFLRVERGEVGFGFIFVELRIFGEASLDFFDEFSGNQLQISFSNTIRYDGIVFPIFLVPHKQFSR